MKVLLVGKDAKNIVSLVKQLEFKIVDKNPEVIISHGGDGTLLSSERRYPGIPKLPIRNSAVCKKCSDHKEEVLLKALLQNKLKLREYSKLETIIENQTIHALNDFVIRNKEPMHSIRFRVLEKFFIGDGIVVSTPFGSTGYFKSITRLSFDKGFGLAFNNPTDPIKPIIFDGNDQFKFKLIRGLADLTFDNGHSTAPVSEAEEVSFRISSKKAQIYELASLRCTDCKRKFR